MSSDIDSDNDLDDLTQNQSREWFANCTPARLYSLMCDIQDGKVNKEEVERAMEYYCYLWETQQAAPKELTEIVVTIFRKYLRGKKSNGTLEAAFGFTGKQGVRHIEQRNLEIATDVARYRLRDHPVKLSISKVCAEYKLSRSVIASAWRNYKMSGIWEIKEECRRAGKVFTPGQLKIALKIQKQENKKVQDFFKKTGN